jgi:flavin reductase (DIM6/NTAB) family NADH-FMN oxidoreductase RutF
VGKFAVNLKDEQFLARYLASFASQGNEDKFRSASPPARPSLPVSAQAVQERILPLSASW